MKVLWLCLTIFCLVVGIVVTTKECKRSKIIPLNFSEISRMERETNLDPLSEYYAKLNDGFMKIFEAYNNYYFAPTQTDSLLARELENHTESTLKVHKYNLTTFSTNIPDLARRSRAMLSNFFSTYEKVLYAHSYLEDAWEDRHVEHTKTEYYTVSVSHTDSNGRTSYTTETRSRQVYDYTHHYYTFYPSKATAAIEKYKAIVGDSIYLPPLYCTKRTGAEGEYAIDKTRKHYGIVVSNYDKYVTLWNTGNVYTRNRLDIIKTFETARQYFPTYMSSVPGSRTVDYKNHNPNDEGPISFQRNEEAKYKLGQMIDYSKWIGSSLHEGIIFTYHYERAKTFIHKVLDERKKGDKGTLLRESNESFKKVFAQDNVSRYKIRWIALWFSLTIVFFILLIKD